MLTEDRVIPYLLERRLLSGRDLVEGTLRVVDVSRRNHNFKVVNESGAGYLVKQGVGEDRRRTVAHEAALYRCLNALAGRAGQARFLPECCAYEADDCVLIATYLSGAPSLLEHHRRSGRFSKRLARALGQTLGTLHDLTRVERSPDLEGLRASAAPPFVLYLHHPRLRIFRQASLASLEFVKILQTSPELCGLLDELRRGWRAEVLIHGDMRWDNCKVCSALDSGRSRRLILVDWEFASLGDPCWDVGTVFNEYLACWLRSAPLTPETPAEQVFDSARYPLEVLQPAVHAFWQAYTRQMKLDPDQSDEWLLRSVTCAGAKLVQTAYERTRLTMAVTSETIYCLQLSLNMLLRPGAAACQLLGFPFSRSYDLP